MAPYDALRAHLELNGITEYQASAGSTGKPCRATEWNLNGLKDQIHTPKEDHDSAFLCGAVTEGGHLALAPL
jgi:hypothetical protein